MNRAAICKDWISELFTMIDVMGRQGATPADRQYINEQIDELSKVIEGLDQNLPKQRNRQSSQKYFNESKAAQKVIFFPQNGEMPKELKDFNWSSLEIEKAKPQVTYPPFPKDDHIPLNSFTKANVYLKDGQAIVPSSPKKRKFRASSLLFYICCVVVIIAALMGSTDMGESGAPRHFGGFSIMRVLTGSMQTDIPQHSLIINRIVDPETLNVGDDITFLVSDNTTVTHRIVAIFENFEDSGERGFQTQGTENRNPDRTIVTPDNIVGRVIFHNLILGHISLFFAQHALWISLFTALGIALAISLKFVFKSPEKPTEQTKFTKART